MKPNLLAGSRSFIKENDFLFLLRMKVLVMVVWFAGLAACNNKAFNKYSYDELSAINFEKLTTTGSFRLSEIEGHAVFIFLSPDCPVCISYTGTLKKLHETFHADEIRFIGVAPGTLYSAEEWKHYADSFGVNIEIISDAEFLLTDFFNATKTPEVFVTDNKGHLLYKGRIDNRAYAPGRKRTVITENDMENVLMKIKNNEPVEFSSTEAVGCIIQRE